MAEAKENKAIGRLCSVSVRLFFRFGNNEGLNEWQKKTFLLGGMKGSLLLLL